MRRTLHLFILTALLLAVSAPAALAEGHDGGEGWWGETSDKIVTNAGFIIIAAFPLLILLLSLLQHHLDKRKDNRKRAAKARVARADQRGGW
jgi:preprotein translocase subunit SecG